MQVDLRAFNSCDAINYLRFDLERGASNLLQLSFELSGSIQNRFATIAEPRDRTFGLWQEDCFELFLRPLDCRQYWELNFAPNGDWNCFLLSDYRQSLEASNAIKIKTLKSRHLTQRYQISATLELAGDALLLNKPFWMGPAAILAAAGSRHYFALEHGNKPDFHCPDHQRRFIN